MNHKNISERTLERVGQSLIKFENEYNYYKKVFEDMECEYPMLKQKYLGKAEALNDCMTELWFIKHYLQLALLD